MHRWTRERRGSSSSTSASRRTRLGADRLHVHRLEQPWRHADADPHRDGSAYRVRVCTFCAGEGHGHRERGER
eukprot:15626481-Heterocapsa_arctica.AAC.1